MSLACEGWPVAESASVCVLCFPGPCARAEHKVVVVVCEREYVLRVWARTVTVSDVAAPRGHKARCGLFLHP